MTDTNSTAASESAISTHTPGPWEADGSKGRGQITIRRAVDKCQPIADMWLNGDDPVANARLIAAAPHMLKVLKGVLRAYDMPGWMDHIASEMASVREAIELATGKSSRTDDHQHTAQRD